MNNYSQTRCTKRCAPVAKPYANMLHENVPLAMAYVPIQEFSTVFDLCEGLKNGTIFPELYKPFLGSKGGCRC